MKQKCNLDKIFKAIAKCRKEGNFNDRCCNECGNCYDECACNGTTEEENAIDRVRDEEKAYNE